jgi:beta-lactamase class A
VRAGVPGDWRVGDKTGSCAHGSTNDVAVAWPPGRPPLIISTYLTETSAPLERRSAALAAVARAVASAYGR